MLERIYGFIDNLISRHRKACLITIVGCLILSLAGTFFIKYENELETMLPDYKVLTQSLSFFKDSSIADKIVLSVSLNKTVEDRGMLIRLSDELSESLEASEYIDEHVKASDTDDYMQQIVQYLSYAPELVSKENLQKLDGELNSEFVANKVKNVFKQLLNPGTSMALPIFQADPLNINSDRLLAMQGIANSTGYKVNLSQGYFFSEDQKHILLVFRSKALAEGTYRAREVLDFVKQTVADFTVDLNVDMLAANSHAVSNENVLKSDLKLISIFASLVFIILFALVFRDIRVFWIFALPFLSILVSANITSIIYGSLSYFVLGFGAVIAGIAVDYGIHVYVNRVHAEQQIVKIVRPLVLGALTTLTVFVSFFFSSIRGYWQLACFAGLSLLFCLFASLFILPSLLGTKVVRQRKRKLVDDFSGPVKYTSLKTGLWLAFMVLAFMFTGSLDVNYDIQSFDGSEEEIFRQEENFNKVWASEEETAVLVVEGKTLDEALSLSDSIYAQISEQLPELELSSLSQIWPAGSERLENKRNWIKFWTKERVTSLKAMMLKEGERFSFEDEAFKPFYRLLEDNDLSQIKQWPSDMAIFDLLKERHVILKEQRLRVISYFEDSDKNISDLQALLGEQDDVYIVSRRFLSTNIAKDLSREIVKLFSIAAGFIILLVLLILKSFRAFCLTLIPVLTAVFTILLTMTFLGIKISVFALVATIMVIGLAIDYGIFVVHGQHHEQSRGVKLAVGLSALTTVLGAASLLLAKHPVLFVIGVTLVSGVSAGYISAIYVVPALYKMTQFKGRD